MNNYKKPCDFCCCKSKNCKPIHPPAPCIICPEGKTGPQGPQGIPGVPGPIGPKGEKGEIGETGLQGLQGIQGIPGDVGPKGEKGEKGETGLQGLQGIQGVQGEQGIPGLQGAPGKDGTSVTILGSYDTYEELVAEHDTGNVGDSYLVGEDLYVWSVNENEWKNVGAIKGPQGEQGIQGIQGIKGETGPKGEQGEVGPEKIRSAYFVSFNNNYPDKGYEVLSGARLPIQRKELDNANICVLDSTDNTIQFNKTGNYKIEFIVNGYVSRKGSNFNPATDFISVGFRKVDDNILFAGGSTWIEDEISKQLSAQGLFTVNNIAEPFELVNLAKRSMYLKTPNIMNTISDSYFINAPITIIIQYIG